MPPSRKQYYNVLLDRPEGVSFFMTKGPFSTAENTPSFRAEQRGAEHACAPQGPLLYVQKRSENT